MSPVHGRNKIYIFMQCASDPGWVFPVDVRSEGRATASRRVRAQWFHARNHFYGSSITANDFIWGKFSKFRICISYVILRSGFRGSMFLFWKICWHVSHIGKYSESTDSGGTGTAGCCSCIRGHFDGPPKRVACARVSITLAWKFSSWQFWSARTAWYFPCKYDSKIRGCQNTDNVKGNCGWKNWVR